MTEVWKGIDPNEAEAQLRGLKRRLDDLDIALRSQQELLKERPDSFSFQLANQSLLRMQENLSKERAQLLSYRVAEKLDLVLDGGAFQNHTANIGALGTLLIRLQKLYSSIGQSLTQGPTLRGPLAGGLVDATELRLAATYASSFGMSLVVAKKQDLVGSDLPSYAFAEMFGLLDKVGDEKSIMAASGELGGRSLNHFKHIAGVLARSGSSIRFEWFDSTGIRHSWKGEPAYFENALTKLAAIKETRSTSVEVVGRIVGASLLRNRFEMILDGGAVVEGSITAPTASAITDLFGKVCVANLDETEVHDRSSQETRVYYTLTAIRLADSLPPAH